ncbi:MAG: T9SS type A sorting domain-containing protein [Bacteroidetes bacterium]|nr:T9SS type A sorting domain-containing protein [Bacteroidota bacterium]
MFRTTYFILLLIFLCSEVQAQYSVSRTCQRYDEGWDEWGPGKDEIWYYTAPNKLEKHYLAGYLNEYRYDQNDNPVRYGQFKFNSVLQQWVLKYVHYYDYDLAGYLIRLEKYFMKEEDDSLLTAYWTYVNDSSGNNLEYKYYPGTWQFALKEWFIYTYDSLDRLETLTRCSGTGQVCSPYYEYYYYYDTITGLLKEIHQTNIGFTGKSYYTYTPFDSLAEIHSFVMLNDSVWINSSKEAWEYNSINRRSMYTHFRWKDNLWDTVRLFNYFYDAQGRLDTTIETEYGFLPTNSNDIDRCIYSYRNEISASRRVSEPGNLVFNLFPNPANLFIQILIGSNEKNSQHRVTIYDISGTIVYDKAHHNKYFEIDVGMLPSGIYFTHILNDHQGKRVKFIKQ